MKDIYFACHIFIAAVFAAPWCYLLLAVLPQSWLDVLVPFTLVPLLLAIYFSAKFRRDRNLYSGLVACIYVGAFVVPILSIPFILKPQLEAAT